jgi:hypothetical protein
MNRDGIRWSNGNVKSNRPKLNIKQIFILNYENKIKYRVGCVGWWICINCANVICAWSCKFSISWTLFNVRVSVKR